MRLLLDTCAVIFANQEPERLSGNVRAIISDPTSQIFVSAVTHAEIACAVAKQRLTLPMPWEHFLPTVARQFHWHILPVTLECFEGAYELPGDFHKDPCDRIIVATARLHGFTLVTTDGLILDYPHVKSMS